MRRRSFHLGTGYGDELLAQLREQLDRTARRTSPFADEVEEKDVSWVQPKLVGEFGFTEWTSAGKLRGPRFPGLRLDKKPRNGARERPGWDR